MKEKILFFGVLLVFYLRKVGFHRLQVCAVLFVDLHSIEQCMREEEERRLIPPPEKIDIGHARFVGDVLVKAVCEETKELGVH